MKRLLFLPALALALIVFMALAGGNQAEAQASTLDIKAGNGEAGISVNSFLPAQVAVITGTTVRWSLPYAEPHSISIAANNTLPEPSTPTPSPATWPGSAAYLDSDLIFGGNPANPPQYSVTFAQAGSYTYFCKIHPAMVGKVTVYDAGSAGAAGVDNQGSANLKGAAEYNSRFLAIKGVNDALKAAPTAVADKGGAKQYTVIAGGANQNADDVNLFFVKDLKVKEGDSVIWQSPTFTPHTVTFGPPQGDPFTTPGDADGLAYSGAGTRNSGIIAAFGKKSFEVVFPKAGTYQYICLLHADQGMVGTVTVEARGVSAPLPPNTGSGLAIERGSALTGWLLVIGAAIVVTAMGAGTVAAVKR